MNPQEVQYIKVYIRGSQTFHRCETFLKIFNFNDPLKLLVVREILNHFFPIFIHKFSISKL